LTIDNPGANPPGVCTTAVLTLDDCDGVCVSLTVAVLVTAAPPLISAWVTVCVVV
jgi:hypothetical protein